MFDSRLHILHTKQLALRNIISGQGFLLKCAYYAGEHTVGSHITLLLGCPVGYIDRT
jgi:hypothetical protein